MKKTTCFILLSVFFFSLVKPILRYFEYVLDYDYIATVLCINKENPELKCNGKCYLKDQLSKANNSGGKDNQSEPKIEFKKFACNCYNSFGLNEVYRLFSKKRIWIPIISIYSGWLKAIVPPPKSLLNQSLAFQRILKFVHHSRFN